MVQNARVLKKFNSGHGVSAFKPAPYIDAWIASNDALIAGASEPGIQPPVLVLHVEQIHPRRPPRSAAALGAPPPRARLAQFG